MKYNWTNYKLEDILDKLLKLLNDETDAYRIELINHDIETVLSHFKDNCSIHNDYSLLENYEDLKLSLEAVSFAWDDFYEFNRIVDYPIDAPIFLKNCTLSKDDLLTLTHDFFKSLDRNLYGNFMKSFYRRKDHIRFYNLEDDKLQGETLFMLSLNEAFISIKRENTIEDVTTVAHEYMHTISAMLNPERAFYVNDDIFSETDTLFIELIMNDYLRKTLNDDNATTAKIIKHNAYYTLAEEMVDRISLIKSEQELNRPYKNNKEIKNIANKVCFIFPEAVENLLKHPKIYDVLYLNSYIYALELYHLYKEDKEKALYTLKKMILLNSTSDIESYHQMIRLGIIPNDHLKETHNSFIKEMAEINYNEELKRTRKINY